MSQVSITLDAAVLESFKQLIETFSNQVTVQTTNNAPVADPEPAQLAPFNEFVTQELTPVFGKQISERIVNLLEQCRRSYDFGAFRNAYRWAEKDNIEQRQLLLTVSAAYRYKFGILEKGKSKLKSQIKWDTLCPHCGKFAIKLIQRLETEGLW